MGKGAIVPLSRPWAGRGVGCAHRLLGVVDRPVGSHEGYDYSPQLKEHGGKWDYVNLDEMIASPATHIPGTKMAFAGLPKPEDRANVIAYLAANP